MDGTRITAAELSACGPVVQAIYRKLYPEGLTRGELEELAKSQGWMRRILAALDKEGC